MGNENTLEEQVKTLNENLASQDYKAVTQTANLMMLTHHKSAEDIAPVIKHIIPILKEIANNAPWFGYDLIAKLLTYHYVVNSPALLAEVTDAILPIVPLIVGELGNSQASYIATMLQSANKNSPDGLAKIRNSVPSMIAALVTNPLQLSQIAYQFVGSDDTPSPQELNLITTATLNILPNLAKIAPDHAASIIKSLWKGNSASREEQARIREVGLSIVPDIAEKDGDIAINTILTLVPYTRLTDQNILCKNFARSAGQDGKHFIWFVPKRTPETTLVIAAPKNSSADKLSVQFNFQTMSDEGQLLIDMFSDKATPQETAEKIKAKTGADYQALTL